MARAYQIKSVDAALAHLADASSPVSVAALYALSALDKADTQKVRSAWPSIPADRRAVAMRHMVELAEESFEVEYGAMYRLGLTDPEPAVRAAALDGLWEDNDPALIPQLTSLLQSDEHDAVRAAAAGALGFFMYAGEIEEIPAERVAPAAAALKAAFNRADEAVEVRRRALESLGFLSFDEVGDLIRQGYAHQDPRLRQSAVFAMGRSADDRWGEIVMSELDSDDPAMRFEAARAAGELEWAPAARRLAELVQDDDDEVPHMAIWALGQIGGDKARAVLTAVLESDAEHLHEDAEDALAELEFKGDNLDFMMFDFSDADEDEEWVLDESAELYDDDEDDDDE